jgi:hypothetical protein
MARRDAQHKIRPCSSNTSGDLAIDCLVAEQWLEPAEALGQLDVVQQLRHTLPTPAAPLDVPVSRTEIGQAGCRGRTQCVVVNLRSFVRLVEQRR